MKILVIRFSSIGDLVLTSPVVRCLKEQLKDAEIHFLCKKEFASIVEHNPNVDKVFTLDASLKKTIIELKKEKYDWIIDLHHNLRSMRVKVALKASSKSFNKINVEKWLIVRFKVNRLPDLHIVDRYMETVKHLGVENDKKGLDFFIPKEDEIKAQEFNAKLENSFIAFAIGARHNTKKLPPEKIISICSKIENPIVLIGGKGDEAIGKQIEKTVPNAINACGKLRLGQSASMVQQSDAVITHDTGMMHIAAAFGKKVISVWGNTIPEFGMYPYLPQNPSLCTAVQVSNLSCRPCSKIGFDECPKEHFKCMREIGEGEIIENLS